MDPDYTLCSQRCLSCHHQAHYSHFLGAGETQWGPSETATGLLTGDTLTLETTK